MKLPIQIEQEFKRTQNSIINTGRDAPMIRAWLYTYSIPQTLGKDTFRQQHGHAGLLTRSDLENRDYDFNFTKQGLNITWMDIHYDPSDDTVEACNLRKCKIRRI